MDPFDFCLPLQVALQEVLQAEEHHLVELATSRLEVPQTLRSEELSQVANRPPWCWEGIAANATSCKSR